jgi:hypothetical protein
MNKCASILALTVLAGLVPATARADMLDQRLFEELPAALKKLEEKGYKSGSNIGVLRFRLQRGSAKASFKAPLCEGLASRLENMLVIRNSEKEEEARGIIHDAGRVATKNKLSLWYTKPDLRKKLFEQKYPLAWGQDEGKPAARVTPDVFLTGLLKTTPDMKTTTVTIQYFDKKDTDPKELATFTFKSDRNIVRGFGYSFAIPSKERQRLVATRSAKDENVDDLIFEDMPKQEQQEKEKKQDDEKEQKPARKKPKQDTSATPNSVGGVQLQMLINGKPAAFSPTTDGDPVMWQVTSPKPGQTVTFRLRNNSAREVGVVLRLNGRSTYDEQGDTPEKCQKWVINPGKSNLIEGFYKLVDDVEGRKKVQVMPIKVAVGEEAKRAREAYLAKAGLIEVDVFEKGSDEVSDDERPKVSAKGLPPSREQKMRESYVSLREAMIKSAGLKRTRVETREFLVPDDAPSKTTDLEEVPFKNPMPVASITIKVVPAAGDKGDDDDLPVED